MMLYNAALPDTRGKDFEFHSTPHATRNTRTYYNRRREAARGLR